MRCNINCSRLLQHWNLCLSLAYDSSIALLYILREFCWSALSNVVLFGHVTCPIRINYE